MSFHTIKLFFYKRLVKLAMVWRKRKTFIKPTSIVCRQGTYSIMGNPKWQRVYEPPSMKWNKVQGQFDYIFFIKATIKFSCL